MRRNIKLTSKASKRATSKQAPKQAAPKAAETSTATPRVLARDAANIHEQRTHFGKITPRDNTYLRCLYESGATEKRAVSLAALAAKFGERNPYYSGSAKLTDVGAFVRLIKAGRITETNTGEYRFTNDKAASEAANISKRNIRY